MRLALVSTPRSGNTWLRYLLAQLYGLEQFAVHTPEALDWSSLPQECIVQLHWHRTPAFQALLERHGFRVVVICRHPLDVLISILHFAPHEPETAQWLSAENGDERDIHRASPVDPAFIRYATGARARALLSVSREWWSAPGVVRVRYEQLAADPERALNQLAQELGPVKRPITAVVDAHRLERLQPASSNQHFWRGQPGLWRSLLPQEVAATIAAAHPASLHELGYQVDPDPRLDHGAAVDHWTRIR